MGIYTYRITGTKAMPSVTSGKVSTFKFAHRAAWYDHDEVRRNERKERRWIDAWGDKPWAHLLVTHDRVDEKGRFHYGRLSVWSGSTIVADECVDELAHGLAFLPENELFALEQWVMDAIQSVQHGLLDFVPTKRKHVGKLTEYRMLCNELTRRRAAGQTDLQEQFSSVDDALAYGKATINW